MIMPNIIIPLIFFILLNSTVSVVSKEKFGTALPFTFLFASILMYFSGFIFGTFNVGFIILIILCLVSIPLYFVLLKKDYINSSFLSENIFTAGFIGFIIIFFIWCVLDYGFFFRKWDELSHWGVMIKEMLRLDNFYSVPESTLNWHKEYPPIIQCFELLWVKVSFKYSEMAVSMALHVLMFALPITWTLDNYIEIFGSNKKNSHDLNDSITNVKNGINNDRERIITEHKSRGKFFTGNLIFITILIANSILIVNAFDGEGVLTTIYTDFCYIMFYVFGMMVIYSGKVWKSAFNAIALIMAMSSLMITKQMGVAFWGILFWSLIISFLMEEKKDIKSGVCKIVSALIFPTLTYLSWSKYCSKLGLSGQFDLGNITISGVIDSVTGKVQDSAYETSRVYFDYLFSKNLFVGRISVTYFGFFIFAILLIALMAFIIKSDRRRFIMLGSSFIVGTIGYAFTMLILYMYCFPGEAPAVCFERYMGTYVISEAVILFLIICNIIMVKLKRSDVSYSANIFMVVFLIAIIVLTKGEQLANLRPAFLKDNNSAKYMKMADKLEKCTEPGSTILVVDDNQGYRRNYIHYYLTDREFDVEFGDIYNYDFSDDSYNTYFIDALSQDDYLYIVNLNDSMKEFLEVYTALGSVEKKGIYKIEVVDGTLGLKALSK